MAACCSDASNGQESSVSPLNRCPRLIRRPERDLVRYPFCCYHRLFRSKTDFQNNIFHFFYILLGDYNCRKFFGNYNATATYSVNQNKTKQLTLLNPLKGSIQFGTLLNVIFFAWKGVCTSVSVFDPYICDVTKNVLDKAMYYRRKVQKRS